MADRFQGFIVAGTPEHRLLKRIDHARLPQHVAVIMDGNGRWAKDRKLSRTAGHRQGVEAAREITECSARLGIRFLTLFTFSSENWQRPKREVEFLMNLLHRNLLNRRRLLTEHRIRLKVLGDSTALPLPLRTKLQEVEADTADHDRMQLNLALSYGSRAEIVAAVRRIIAAGLSGEQVTPEILSRFLYTAGMPDPDLLIRTSGELRISNFLLYQLAYTELFFTATLWPDFRTRSYLQALIEFQGRSRRFGNV